MEEKVYTLDGVYDSKGNKIDDKTVRRNADKMLEEVLNGGEYEDIEKNNDNAFEDAYIDDGTEYQEEDFKEEDFKEEDFKEEDEGGGEEIEESSDDNEDESFGLEQDEDDTITDEEDGTIDDKEKNKKEKEEESDLQLTEDEISKRDIVLYIDGEKTTIKGSKFVELAKLGLDYYVNKDKYDDLNRISKKISNLGLTEKDIEVFGAFVSNPSKETLAGFLANFGIDINDLSDMLIDTSDEDINNAKNYLNTQNPMKPFEDYYNSIDNISKNKLAFLVDNIKGFREYLNAFVNSGDINGFKVAVNTMLNVDANKLLAKYKSKLLTMNQYDIMNLTNPQYFVSVMNEILSGIIGGNSDSDYQQNSNININNTNGGDMASNIKKKKSLGNIKRRNVVENNKKNEKSFEEEVSELLQLDDDAFNDRLERARQRIIKSGLMNDV